MGTSGAYGGSGASAWDSAHTAYEGPAGPPASTADSTPGSTPPVEQLLESLLKALRRGNAAVASGRQHFDTGTLRPTRGAAGGHTRSSTGGGGRVGSGGLGRSTARGAAAVGGAAAYRARDAEALAGLGLDLAALQALPNHRARCTAIADAVLGAPAHPDDAALKAAAIQTMMDALRSPEETSSEELVETFTANLTYELVLVEMTSQHRRTAVPPREATATEQKIKRYLRAALRTPRSRARARLSTQALVDRAVTLAAKALNIFVRRS